MENSGSCLIWVHDDRWSEFLGSSDIFNGKLSNIIYWNPDDTSLIPPSSSTYMVDIMMTRKCVTDISDGNKQIFFVCKNMDSVLYQVTTRQRNQFLKRVTAKKLCIICTYIDIIWMKQYCNLINRHIKQLFFISISIPLSSFENSPFSQSRSKSITAKQIKTKLTLENVSSWTDLAQYINSTNVPNNITEMMKFDLTYIANMIES